MGNGWGTHEKDAGGVVPFRRPPTHSITIGGVKLALSDVPPPMLAEIEDMAADPRLIRGPKPTDPFKYLWLYNTDHKTLIGFRVTDGNEKHYGPAHEDAGLVVKLDKKGQLNRVPDHVVRDVESEMRHREDELLRSLQKYIAEHEDDFQKTVNKLTQDYFDEFVRPKIDRGVADVLKGATPIGFKPYMQHRPIEEQKVVHVLDSVMSRELTTHKVDAYLMRHGVDLEAGDRQASYWALNDVRDAAYDEYLKKVK
jgi:hypothetical protein